MKRLAAFLLSLIAALPAEAGCERFGSTPLDAYREINARPGSYVMAVGRFSDGAVLDVIYALATDGSETSTRLIAGRFEGMSATAEGFTNPLDAPVEISQRCDAAGCHPRLDETRYLMFLQRVRGRLQFAEDGCTVRAFPDPAAAVLETLIGCMNGRCD